MGEEEMKMRQQGGTFAKGLNGYKLFWIFFVGCFIGVVIETIWCLIVWQRLECRSGLIYGPFNPVYGFGAVVMTICLHWLSKKRDLYIFLGGGILGGAFEFLCSWIQELMLGTVSWEYSGTPFNLQGRTNLLYAFFWGILALVWVKNLYPLMSRWIEKIPRRIGKPLTWALIVFMTANMAVSAAAIARQTARRSGIPPQNAMERFIDRHYTDELLKIIYPNMISSEEKPQR